MYDHSNVNFRNDEIFPKEVRVMVSLKHANIVQIYGILLQPSHSLYAIVMEYMELGSMDILMKKVPNMAWSIKVSHSSKPNDNK